MNIKTISALALLAIGINVVTYINVPEQTVHTTLEPVVNSNMPPVSIPQVVKKSDHVYTITIKGLITDETQNAIEGILFTLTPSDELDITINSPGGMVYAGSGIMNDLLNAKVKTVCIVNDGMAASAAAMILMGCHDKVVASQAHVLFHLPYMEDKEGNMIREETVSEWYVNLLNSEVCLNNVLGQQDYLKFLLGGDIMYNGTEFNQHLSKSCLNSPDSIEKQLKSS